MTEPPRYYLGLDLGQAADYTALAVLERTSVPDPSSPRRPAAHYAARHLERFPLGTPYTAVVERVARACALPPLTGATLAVDETGVGRPVVDMFRRAKVGAQVRPITITAGHKATFESGRWLVPKKELVSVVQVLLQTGRLKFAEGLSETPTLVKELANFQVRITQSANETFGPWREGDHDDLVLATAIAAWTAERISEARMQ